MKRQETAATNSTYPKGGVLCSNDSFVVNQTLVFQIKFCGKSPALRVAAKRSHQPERAAERDAGNKMPDIQHTDASPPYTPFRPASAPSARRKNRAKAAVFPPAFGAVSNEAPLATVAQPAV